MKNVLNNAQLLMWPPPLPPMLGFFLNGRSSTKLNIVARPLCAINKMLYYLMAFCAFRYNSHVQQSLCGCWHHLELILHKYLKIWLVIFFLLKIKTKWWQSYLHYLVGVNITWYIIWYQTTIRLWLRWRLWQNTYKTMWWFFFLWQNQIWMWMLVIPRQVVSSASPWSPMWNNLSKRHHMFLPLVPCLTTLLICSKMLK